MKIISGGQTGADQAGLYAAFYKGIETGGFAPSKFMTLDGSDFSLRDKFGLVEVQGGYKKRTYMNVQNSDCTLRFAFNFNSAGEKCTFNAIKEYDKPHTDIDLGYPITYTMIKEVGDWIIENDFKIINIAGNAQSKLDVFTPVYDAMCKLIDYLRKE